MDSNQIKYNLESLVILNNYSFVTIEQDHLKKLYPCLDSFIFEGTNKKAYRIFNMLFTSIDKDCEAINRFYIDITNTATTGFKRFNLNVYLNKKVGAAFLDKMCLDFYEGDFHQKLEQFFIFFSRLIEEDNLIKSVLLGEFWTDEFHKNIYENYV